jgi:drug/metabolite transporter (DMT)-like permease
MMSQRYKFDSEHEGEDAGVERTPIGRARNQPGVPLSGIDIALTLAAALLHATWNAVVKGSGDRLLLLAAITVICQLLGGIFVPFVTPPDPASWPFILASLMLHGGYYVFLLQAYRVGDLSHVYPLARGMAPLLVTGGSALFAQEFLAAPALAGVVLASLGICSFAFGTSLFIAAYTLVDGSGVRLSGHPFGYIAWLFLLDGFGIALIAAYMRWGQLARFMRGEWKTSLGGGIAAALAYGLVVYAMNFGAMALVSALRETSVVFAAFIGTVFLRERITWRRALSASVIAGGLILTSF